MHIHYSVARETLSDAALIFFEHSRLHKVVIKILWVMALFMVALTILKILVIGIQFPDGVRLVVSFGWLFYWRPLLRRLSNFFLKRRIGASHHYRIGLDAEHLSWDTGKVSAQITWRKMGRALVCPNGYVFPAGSIRYLWVPSDALSPEQTTLLLSALSAHNVTQIKVARWCGPQPKK